jgi:hypothetical protein
LPALGAISPGGCPSGFSEVLAEESPFVDEGLRRCDELIAEMVGKRKKTRGEVNLGWVVTEKKGSRMVNCFRLDILTGV